MHKFKLKIQDILTCELVTYPRWRMVSSGNRLLPRCPLTWTIPMQWSLKLSDTHHPALPFLHSNLK
jgi:hypothetical protein